MNVTNKQAVVLGMSDRPDSYARMAATGLMEQGYRVVGVSPKRPVIKGVTVVPDLAGVVGEVDLLTVYVSAKISSTLVDDIVALAPKKVILNPGAENPALEEALKSHGIPYERACTLVLLRLGLL